MPKEPVITAETEIGKKKSRHKEIPFDGKFEIIESYI